MLPVSLATVNDPSAAVTALKLSPIDPSGATKALNVMPGSVWRASSTATPEMVPLVP